MSERFKYPQGIVDETTGKEIRRSGGITLREHFAGLMAVGLLTNSRNTLIFANAPLLADYAVLYADALLAELEKKP